ncbi:MAG: substrate-binding domain-containing protein, partial [Clostridiales bacterium]|nr:substrate-binding domain-containing protein [Clostridiales bacterium]
MKKFVKLLVSSALVAAMAFGVCACGGSTPTQAPAPTDAPATEAPTTEAPKTDELIKVGIINNDPNESGYRTANDRDMKATFTKENGYEASFFYSLKNEEQIAAAQKFIQDEVDYLLISAAGTSGWDGVLEQAQKAGIKVILFDRTIDAD